MNDVKQNLSILYMFYDFSTVACKLVGLPSFLLGDQLFVFDKIANLLACDKIICITCIIVLPLSLLDNLAYKLVLT